MMMMVIIIIIIYVQGLGRKYCSAFPLHLSLSLSFSEGRHNSVLFFGILTFVTEQRKYFIPSKCFYFRLYADTLFWIANI
jgi:hypothetical protein